MSNKWEYKVEHKENGPLLEEELDVFGNEGWELVNILEYVAVASPTDHRLVDWFRHTFKRKKDGIAFSKEQVDSFKKNKVYHIKDDYKECLICMELNIEKETLKELENHKDKLFICLERSLDTTMKWNLKHLLGDKLIAF